MVQLRGGGVGVYVCVFCVRVCACEHVVVQIDLCIRHMFAICLIASLCCSAVFIKLVTRDF